MSKVSILIPVRSEKVENLNRTIDSIHQNVSGEIARDYEVILGLDGRCDYISQGMQIYKGCKILYFPDIVGIKTNINAMAAMATGKYIYKSDAHCSFSKGFDEVLQKDMQDDWIVMPRFFVLNEETWEWQDDRFYDYFYLCCPFTDSKGIRFKAGGHWPERTKERFPGFRYFDTVLNKEVQDNYLIDETPQIHGSGWMMTKDRFFELEGFPNIDIAGHAQEPIWLAMKNWMAGGKVMVNKDCWYAHMHKNGDKDRGYHIPNAQNELSYKIAADFFLNDKWNDTWPKRTMSFEQFIEKFMPMPTWPENWKELLHDYQKSYNKEI